MATLNVHSSEDLDTHRTNFHVRVHRTEYAGTGVTPAVASCCSCTSNTASGRATSTFAVLPPSKLSLEAAPRKLHGTYRLHVISRKYGQRKASACIPQLPRPPVSHDILWRYILRSTTYSGEGQGPKVAMSCTQPTSHVGYIAGISIPHRPTYAVTPPYTNEEESKYFATSKRVET